MTLVSCKTYIAIKILKKTCNMRTTVSQHFKNPRIRWNPWFLFYSRNTNEFSLKITNDTMLNWLDL